MREIKICFLTQLWLLVSWRWTINEFVTKSLDIFSKYGSCTYINISTFIYKNFGKLDLCRAIRICIPYQVLYKKYLFPGITFLIHKYHFLHLKMPVPSQEYDICCPFVWCVLSFDFAIWLKTFRFEFSYELSIFVFNFFFRNSKDFARFKKNNNRIATLNVICNHSVIFAP